MVKVKKLTNDSFIVQVDELTQTVYNYELVRNIFIPFAPIVDTLNDLYDKWSIHHALTYVEASFGDTYILSEDYMALMTIIQQITREKAN